MTHSPGNLDLQILIQASGLSNGEFARRANARAYRAGHRQVATDATRVRRWMDGEQPRPPIPGLLAEELSETLGTPLTPRELGLVPTGMSLDTIEIPLLTEPAAETIAGWPRMDLLMLDRRETLKLAAGAPLIAAAGHLLDGGTARSLNRAQAGFNTDNVAALASSWPRPTSGGAPHPDTRGASRHRRWEDPSQRVASLQAAQFRLVDGEAKAGFLGSGDGAITSPRLNAPRAAAVRCLPG
jgi:hypothetical protein